MKRLAIRYLLLALVALAAGAAVYGTMGRASAESERSGQTAAGRSPASPAAHTSRADIMPTASEFADTLLLLGNTYASQHRDPSRLARADCVQASPGHYMCSYIVTRPGRPGQCHLVQARWTPEQPSAITVTLSSRVRRCETLKDALRSLQ